MSLIACAISTFCEMLSLVSSGVVGVEHFRKRHRRAPADMRIFALDIRHRPPPVEFARGQLPEEQPHPQHGHYDQRRYDEQLHDKARRGGLHLRQVLHQRRLALRDRRLVASRTFRNILGSVVRVVVHG